MQGSMWKRVHSHTRFSIMGGSGRLLRWLVLVGFCEGLVVVWAGCGKGRGPKDVWPEDVGTWEVGYWQRCVFYLGYEFFARA